MSINYSTGTASVERILRLYYGNLSIGTAMTDSLGTSDIRQIIEDAERYIDALLEDTITATPVSPVPSSLKFASDYLSSYLIHTNIFAANKPGEESAVVKNWKEMAEKAIDSYKKGYNTGDANIASYSTMKNKVFTTRGVKGIGEGLLEDADEVKSYYKK